MRMNTGLHSSDMSHISDRNRSASFREKDATGGCWSTSPFRFSILLRYDLMLGFDLKPNCNELINEINIKIRLYSIRYNDKIRQNISYECE